ncbi:hypothetical protein ACS0VN_22670, partial [Salmonella enterica subsp. enterica serovar Paratyphi A]
QKVSRYFPLINRANGRKLALLPCFNIMKNKKSEEFSGKCQLMSNEKSQSERKKEIKTNIHHCQQRPKEINVKSMKMFAKYYSSEK